MNVRVLAPTPEWSGHGHAGPGDAGLREAARRIWIPSVVLAAAAAGFAVAHGNPLPIGAAVLIPAVVLASQLRPTHWIVAWLFVGGLLAWAPGVSLYGSLPDLTAERLALILVGLFAGVRCVATVRGLWIWPALFTADYLLMAGFYSPDLREALLTFVRHYMSAFVLFLVAAASLTSARSRAGLLGATPIVGGVVALVALLQPLAGWDFGVDASAIAWGSRLGGTLESPPVLGAGLAVLLFMSLFDVINSSPRRRLVTIFACALMLAAILLTFTRAAWLSVLVGLTVLGVAAARRQPILAVLLIALIVATVSFGPAVISTLSDDPRLQDDANAVGRFQTSVLSAQLFLERPVFGWGPLTVGRFATSTGYGDWVSHDSFLTILVASGLLGSLFYFGPAFFALGRGVRSVLGSASPLRSTSTFALAGAVVYIVNALAIDMRYFAYPHVLFWMCLGLLVADRPASPANADI